MPISFEDLNASQDNVQYPGGIPDSSTQPEDVSIQQNFDPTKYRKYLGQDFDPQRLSYEGGIDKQRALNQSGLQQAGSAGGQMLTEATLGTVQAFAGIFDPESLGALYKRSKDADDNFSNIVYETAANLKDEVNNELFPIYSADRFDSGWWFKNAGQTIGSAVSFMLPGMVAAKGIAGVVKLMKLGTAVSELAGTLGGAGIMRRAEGFMEANNVYKDLYPKAYEKALKNGKNESEADEYATHIAGEGANLDYKMNSINMVFDAMQLGAVLKPLKGLSRTANSFAVDAAEGFLPETKVGKAWAFIKDPAKGMLSEASEGVEEVVNQISQYEATRHGEIQMGTRKDDGSYFGDRLSTYMKDPDVQDSFMWGLVGGVAFKGIATAAGLDENKSVTKAKLNDISRRSLLIKEFSTRVNQIKNGEQLLNDKGDVIVDYSKYTDPERESAKQELNRDFITDLTLSASRAGNTGSILRKLDDKEFQGELIQAGVATEENIATRIPEIKKQVEQVETSYNKYYNAFYEKPIESETKDMLISRLSNYENQVAKNNDKLKELKTQEVKIVTTDPIVQAGQSDLLYINSVQKQAVKLARLQLEMSKEESKDPFVIKTIDNALKSLKEQDNALIPENASISIGSPNLVQNIALQKIFTEYNKGIINKIDAIQNDKNTFDAEIKDIEKVRNKKKTSVKEGKIKLDTEEKNTRIDQEKADNDNKLYNSVINKIVNRTTPDIKFSPEEAQYYENYKDEIEDRIQRIILEDQAFDEDNINYEAELAAQGYQPDVSKPPVIESNNTTKGDDTDNTDKIADIEKRRQKEIEPIGDEKFLDSKTELSRTTYNVENAFTDTNASGKIKVTVITYKDGTKRASTTIEDGSKVPLSEAFDGTLSDAKIVKTVSGNGDIIGKGIKKNIVKSAQQNKIDKINAKYDFELSKLNEPSIAIDESIPTIKSEELQSHEDTKIIQSEDYTDESEEKVKSEFDDISIKQDTEYDYIRSENWVSALAYLSREYEQLVDGSTVNRKNINNELHPNFNSEILNPDKWNAGDEVELVIDDNDDIDVYNEASLTKTSIKWGAIKNDSNFNAEVPIRIVKNGVRTNTFLHTVSSIKEENVSGDINSQKTELKLIRDHIVNKKSLKTKITSKTPGVFFKDKDFQHVSLKEALKDGQVIIGVGHGVNIMLPDGKYFNGSLTNKQVFSGLTYMLVRTNKNDYTAIPVSKKKISGSKYQQQVIDTIINAVDAFLDQNNKKNLIKTIYDSSKINISQIAGLEDFLKQFIYLYNTNGKMLREILPNLKINTKSKFISITNSVIEFMHSTATSGKTLSLSEKKQDNKSQILDALRKTLPDFYLSTNIKGLESTVSFISNDGTVNSMPYKEFVKETSSTSIIFNKVDEVDGKAIYSPMIQPVITLDFSEILLKDKETTPESDDKAVIKVNNTIVAPKSSFNIDDDFLSPTSVDLVEQSLSRILIKELGIYKQDSLTSYLSRIIIRDKIANKDKDVNKIIRETLVTNRDKWESELTEIEQWLIDNPTDSRVSKYEKLRDITKSIITNYDIIKRQTIIKAMKANKLTGRINDDIDLDLEDVEDNEKINYDKSSYEHDLRDKLSVEIRRLLCDISNPQKKSIIDGTNELMDFDIIYNNLQMWTSGLTPDFNKMISAIKAHEEYFPWASEVITKLEALSEDQRNKFVVNMTNHKSSHYMILWDQSKEKGFTTSIIEVSSSTAYKVVVENWRNNLRNSSLVKVNTDGEYVYDSEQKDKLISEIEGIYKSKDKVKARAWLESLGIVLDDKTWNSVYLKEETRTVRGAEVTRSFKSRLVDEHFPFKILEKQLRQVGENTSINDKDILDQTTVNNLAKLDARMLNQVFANSFRSGNKTVYSFGANKFLVNQIRDLKDKENPLRQVLLNTTFHRQSLWLKSKMNENFEIGAMALTSLKKANSKERDERELYNLSPDEYEGVLLGGLYSALSDLTGGTNRVILTMYPTTSDKTTATTIKTEAADISFDIEGNISNDSIDQLYDQLVLPEIERILQYENLQESGELQHASKEFQNGGHKFILMPSINNIPGIWEDSGKLNLNIQNKETVFNSAIKEVLKANLHELVARKLQDWENFGFTVDGKAKNLPLKIVNSSILRNVNTEHKAVALATDMVYQYLISNANCFTSGLITDPAGFFKSKVKDSVAKRPENTGITGNELYTKYTPEDRIQEIMDTFINIGKRLAGDIAPGSEGADFDKGIIRQLFLTDRAVDSIQLAELKELFKDNPKRVEAYSKEGTLEEGTNAQEFTTLTEELFIAFKYGEITEELYFNATKAINDAISVGNHNYTDTVISKLNETKNGLGDEFKKLVFQVRKPVYVQNMINPKTNLYERIYIKTSSYPLTPKTKGLEIDKLRILMEKNQIDRAAFSSGIKVGNFKSPLDIWSNTGIKDGITNEEVDSSVKTLPRSGFRIQQEIPYDPMKLGINRVSQASKNLFLNIKDIEGFEYNGKKYSGADLEKEYLKLYNDVYKLQKEELDRSLTDKSGNLDISKLRDLLMDEIQNREYPLSAAEALELDENLRFLAYSPYADKYESLLNSIVKSRVLRIDFTGKSFVLSTEEGYQMTKDDFDKKIKSSEITFTKNWTGQLLPSRIENGIVKPAQVIIPWKFKNGKDILDIKEFIDKDGLIDTSKLPGELLNIFGMRIPNQGLNSQSWIEVVGFFPKNQGDTIVATRDYLAQMGSDFDVDKLYTYMYASEYIDGRLQRLDPKLISAEDDLLIKMMAYKDGQEVIDAEIAAIGMENAIAGYKTKLLKKDLQNKILDIHIAIHKNPNADVQKQIKEPLGFWEFKDAADLVSKTQEKDLYFTGLSDSYQKMKRINALAGKSGVGDFSNASMFNSLVQGKNIYFYYTGEKGEHRVKFTLGNSESDGLLSNLRTIDGKYYISEVISGLQSAAVDNEKEQILDKLNFNKNTFKVVKLLAQLGFTDELKWFTAQPAIVDYLNELQKIRSSLKGFNPNAETDAYNKVIKKYKNGIEQYSEESYKTIYPYDGHAVGLTTKALKGSVLDPKNVANYGYIQLAALNMYKFLDGYGLAIQRVSSTINSDSKGIGKSLFETLQKEEAINTLGTIGLKNITKILGYYNEQNELVPTSIPGFAVKYALEYNNKLWSEFFPYNEVAVKSIFNIIDGLTGKQDKSITQRATSRKKVWDAIKSYLYTKDDLGLFSGDINADRERLFIDSDTNKSLAKKIHEIQELPEFRDRPFINRLQPEINTNGIPSIVKISAAQDQAGEIAFTADLVDLLINDRPIPSINSSTKEIFKDLVAAAYLSGGIQQAVQYIKYIPVAYLHSIPFAEKLKTLYDNGSFGSSDMFNIPDSSAPYYELPNFVIQYMQHEGGSLQRLNYEEDSNDKATRAVDFNILDGSIKNLQSITRIVSKNNNHFTTTVNKTEVKPNSIFIAINDKFKSKGLEKNMIFMHTGEFDKGYPVYHRIDNLGVFGVDEYNSNLQNGIMQSSFIKKNQTSNTVTKKINEKPIVNDVYTEVYSNTLSNVDKTAAELLNVNTGSIDSMLEGIMTHSSDPFYKILADVIYMNIGNFSDVKIDPILTENKGKYNKGIVRLNIAHNANQSVNGLSNTVLHEYLHHIVNPIIHLFENKGVLDSKVKLAVTDLNALFNRYRDIVGKDKIDALIEKLNDKEKRLTISQGELDKIYGATNLSEFVSMLMTNKNLQKILNEIEVSKTGRTWFQAFKEKLLGIFKALGFDIKPNNMLAAAIDDVLTLIEYNNSSNIESSDEQYIKTITDEYGNQWLELDIKGEKEELFYLSPSSIDDLTSSQQTRFKQLQNIGLISKKRFEFSNGDKVFFIPKIMNEYSIAKSIQKPVENSGYAKDIIKKNKLQGIITKENLPLNIRETQKALFVEIKPQSPMERYNNITDDDIEKQRIHCRK